jgi:glycosyltransferase involved in cell wall biosynthesis
MQHHATAGAGKIMAEAHSSCGHGYCDQGGQSSSQHPHTSRRRELGSEARVHLVLIAYHYPPDPEVGSLRSAKVAKAFRAAGHAVTVITGRLAGEEGMRADARGIRVHTVKSLPNAREVYLQAKKILAGKREPVAYATMATGQHTTEARKVARWKRYVGSLLWLPDDRQGFIIAAVRLARQIHRETPIALLYTTAPPFSVHLAGLLLKRATGVPWAAEFRDPWADNPEKPPHVRSKGSDAIDVWMERRCLASADHVVAVSEGIERLLSASVPPERRGRLLLVRSGIEHLRTEARRPVAHAPFRIVHVGTFYHRRDPRPFLSGLAALKNRLNLSAADIQVDLVGKCRHYHDISLEETVATLGLSGIVHFFDWMPHDECLARIAGANLLLLLALEQPNQVPNKLYEYLGMRVPILAFADDAGEVAGMLRRAGGHYLVYDNSAPLVESALCAAYQAHGNGTARVIDESPLEEWSTRTQMTRLVAALGG